MKKILVLILVSIVLFSIVTFHNNSNPKLIISKLLNKGSIESGNLIFEVNFLNIVPVGEARLNAEKIEEHNGKKVYHLSANARAKKAVSQFFAASANLDSYVDMQDSNPILFREKIQIPGKPDINKEISYDQKNGIMSIGGIRRSILPNTQDPLSAVFNLKNFDFDKIRDFEMNFNTNQKNYILKGKVFSDEILINRKPIKIFRLVAEIKRFDKNNPYHKSNITIVLLKEKEENIPVLIKVFSNGFLISVKLIGIS